MALNWPQDKRMILINLGGQFATLGTNVITIKYYYFDKIHTIDQIKP
jgi:hypothetical protein